MGCIQSSSIISALRLLLGVWIRSVSPYSMQPDDRVASHPVELVARTIILMLEGIGPGLAGPSFFAACLSARGLSAGSPPARIRRSRRVRLRWNQHDPRPVAHVGSHASLDRVMPLGTQGLGNDAFGGRSEATREKSGPAPRWRSGGSVPSRRQPRLKPAAQRRSSW